MFVIVVKDVELDGTIVYGPYRSIEKAREVEGDMIVSHYATVAYETQINRLEKF